MAQTLRWPRSLKKQKNTKQTSTERYPKWLLLCIFIGVPGVILALVAQLYFDSTTVIFLFLSWVFIAFLVIYGYKMFTSQPNADNTLKGLEGELAVAYALDRLPEGWFVINDITVSGRQIDHIVVGPTGIFCLETKNWNTAGCDKNGIWYRLHMGNWVPIKQNPAEQNSFHVSAVRNFVNEKVGLKIKVNSVIVLANPNGKYNIQSRLIPPAHTLICLSAEIHQIFFKTKSIILSPDKAKEVAGILAGVY